MRIEESLGKFLVELEADGRSPHTVAQYRRHVRLLAQLRVRTEHGLVRQPSGCHHAGRADHWSRKSQRIRRRYGHRFRDLIHATGDIDLAVGNGVPRSTAMDRSRLSCPEVITLDVARMSEHELRVVAR